MHRSLPQNTNGKEIRLLFNSRPRHVHVERYIQTEGVRPTMVTPNRELLLARDVYCEWVCIYIHCIGIHNYRLCRDKIVVTERKQKRFKFTYIHSSGGILLKW